MKNEMDGGQKSTLRKEKVSGLKVRERAIDQWHRPVSNLSEKRKSDGKEDKGKGRGEK